MTYCWRENIEGGLALLNIEEYTNYNAGMLHRLVLLMIHFCYLVGLPQTKCLSFTSSQNEFCFCRIENHKWSLLRFLFLKFLQNKKFALVPQNSTQVGGPKYKIPGYPDCVMG